MPILQEVLFVGLATTAVLTVALLLSLVRSFSASLRSRILTLAFLVGLVLPLATKYLPAPVHRMPRQQVFASQETTEKTENPGMVPDSIPYRPPVEAKKKASGYPVAGLLALGGFWLLGSLFLLGRLAGSHLRAIRLWRQADPVDDPPLQHLGRRLSAELGCKRPVPLRSSPVTDGPLAMGLVRPGILWPAGQTGLDSTAAEAVLRHELAHVERRDNLTHLGAALVASCYWFNPLVWLALRRLRHLSEQACDDLVLAAGVRPSVYARVLLDLSRRVSCAPRALLGAPTAAFACQTKHRLVSLLDAGANRRLPGRRASIFTVALFLALILPLTAFRPGAFALSAAEPAGDPFRFLRTEVGGDSGQGDWSEIFMEIKEAKALNKLEDDPTLAVPLPEGSHVHSDGAWTMECHDALALPGSKYGCIFSSDEGFVRFSGQFEGRSFEFSVAAVEHGPPSEEDLFLDKIAGFFGLGLNGNYRAYQLRCAFEDHPDGFDGTIRNVFKALVAEAAAENF